MNEILKTESMVVTCQTSVNVVCVHFDLKQMIFLKTRGRELGPMGGIIEYLMLEWTRKDHRVQLQHHPLCPYS